MGALDSDFCGSTCFLISVVDSGDFSFVSDLILGDGSSSVWDNDFSLLSELHFSVISCSGLASKILLKLLLRLQILSHVSFSSFSFSATELKYRNLEFINAVL